MLLAEKTALVTGASRGIGRATALELAKAGAKIALNFAGNRAAAEETASMIEAAGGEVLLVQADVGDSAAVDAMIKAVVARFGKIDILVNNAGITRDNLIMRMKEEEWDAVIHTNLKGIFNCTKAVTRLMMKQKYGRIVNMASVVGVMGNAGQSNYAAAKAGVIGFTKSMAKELASRNITVNAVAPGYISTDMTANLPEQAKTDLQSQIPLQRLGNPEDVAAAVLFLVSPGADYITGQTLHVDGGMVM
jgi:3-oxoacyl-[acyl-carrier protein] reductase